MKKQCKPLSRAEVFRVLHDLETRQEELKLQNDELRIAKEKAEMMLKRAEECLLHQFDNVPFGYQSLNENGILIDVNKAWSEILGYSRNEVIGKWFGNFLSPGLTDNFQKNFQVLKNEGSIYSEFEMLHKNGEQKYIAFDGRVRYKEDGSFEKTYCILRDFTERKKVGKMLVESNSLLETIIDHSPFAMWVSDNKGTVIRTNIYLRNTVKLRDNQIVGKYNIFKDTNLKLAGVMPMVESVYKNHKAARFSVPWTSDNAGHVDLKGGKDYVYIDVSLFPILDSNGTLINVICQWVDITDRIQAEEEVRASRDLLSSIVENAPIRVFWKDIKLRYLGCNTAFANDAGLSDPEELIGKDDFQMTWYEQAELYQADDKEIMKSDKPKLNYEEPQTTPDGKTIWLNTSKVPLHDPNGKVLGILGIYFDVTEQKKAEKALVLAKEKAEESDRLKTAFLQNISHEIRTPMNAIVGFASFLDEQSLDDKNRHAYIEVIIQSSNHLLAIVNDIIEISNIEIGTVKLNTKEANLNTIIRNLHKQFGPVVEEKGIGLSIKTVLSDNNANIYTDGTKLVQVLTNLINNAIKFTDHGQIDFGYILKDNFLEFYVSDTGIGISPDMHNKIFDRFYQIQDSESRLTQGTGLGLAISKAYIELMGGKIWLTSKKSKGSVFYFTIPYLKNDQLVITEDKKIDKKEIRSDNKKTILIAEDEETNFRLIALLLESMNFHILHAWNGKEAVDICASDPNVNLVVMDIKMPVMDGYEATEIIKKRRPELPVIAQTAYVFDAVREKALSAGCDDYISKPFNKELLISTIRKYLQ